MAVILLLPDSPLAHEARSLQRGGAARLVWIDGGTTEPFDDVGVDEQVLVGTSVPTFFLKPLLLACERGACGGVGIVVDGPVPPAHRIGLRWRPWLTAVHRLDDLAAGPVSLPTPLPAPVRQHASLAELVTRLPGPPLVFGEVPCAFPPRVQIQTTTRCRAACPFCPKARQGVPDQEMASELFDALVQQCTDGQPDHVELYLHAEPLEDPHLEARVRRVRTACEQTQVSVVTHEAMPTPAKAAALVEAGLDVLFVSVNVLRTPREGELSRRLGRLVEVAHAVRDGGGELVVTTLTDLLPAGARNRFERRCRDLGLPLERFRTTTRGGDVEPSPWRSGATGRGIGDCTRPFITAHVRADGAVVTCCEDWRYERVLGSVAQRDLGAIWRGPAYRRLRRELLDGERTEPCDRCDLPVLVRGQG